MEAGSRAWVVALGMGGAAGIVAEALILRDWDVRLPWESAIAGALLAHVAWVVVEIKTRLRRSSVIAVAANALVWMLFLAVTPPLTPTEFDAILVERNRRDSGSGLELMTHEPIIVAGRMLGTYGAEGPAERLLQIVASPAIVWTAFLAVPSSYGPARATRAESYVIAAGGLILSSAFWAAFAPAVSSLIHHWRSRIRLRQRSHSM
jgi:hypothetical protein